MDSSTVGQLAGIVIAVLFGLGLYIWSSLALSGVFRKVGEEQWQAWVPVWNSAVLLRVGGYSPWLVLLALVPVLGQVAFLVVFVMACHRITLGFGYGPGMTVVSALWNPVWASVLAWGGSTWSGQPSARPAAPPPVAPWPAQRAAQPPQGYPPQIQQWGSPAQQWTPPAAAAPAPIAQWRPVNPVTPHEDDARAPAAGPVAGPESGQAPVAEPLDPPAPPTPAPGPSPTESVPSPSPATAPLSIGDWSTDTEIPAFVPPPAHPAPVASEAPPVAPVVEPVAPAPAPPAPPVPPPATTPLTSDPLAELRWAPPPDVFRAAPSAETPPPAAPPSAPPSAETPPPAEPPTAVPEVLPDWVPPAAPVALESREPASVPFEEPDTRTLEAPAAVVEPDDRTVLASRVRPSWTLVTSTELELALTGSEVLLGRQPAFDPRHPGAQLLILPDPTRTVSKLHALLRLVDGLWFVRDLGSTNGVTLVAPDGTERMLGRDAEEPLTARFFLGDAEFVLREGPPRP